MAIPRRISFLEESRSRGMTNLHSSGIEEYEIYSSGSSGNFEEWFIPKILKIPPKIQKMLKIIFLALNLHFKVQKHQKMISFPKKHKQKKKNLDKLLKFFWYFHFLRAQKGNLVFSRSSANFGEDSRSRGVIKFGESRSEKRSGTSRIEGRGIPRAIPNPSKCHLITMLPCQRQEPMHLDLSIGDAFDGKSVWYLIYLHEGWLGETQWQLQ